MEHIPEGTVMIPSDDERLDGVEIIDKILDMLEEGDYLESGYGAEDFPQVHYLRQTDVDATDDEYIDRFVQAKETLQELPGQESEPVQAPRGPSPGGVYISHAGFYAAFGYEIETRFE